MTTCTHMHVRITSKVLVRILERMMARIDIENTKEMNRNSIDEYSSQHNTYNFCHIGVT
jgi:hypothetical protein